MTALSEMIAALGLEVAAIRAGGATLTLNLRGGERVGQMDGFWLYRFFVPHELHLRDDTPVYVNVTGAQQNFSGNIVSFREGALVVALSRNIGREIDAAQLVADDSFLIERLKEELERVQTGQTQFNREAAERALGLAPVRSGETAPSPAILQESDQLNEEQIIAVRRSLGSDTTFVWGPPGTGKTKTLARIVEAHYRAGRSVLLVANTNIAVDTAVEHLAKRLEGEPEFCRGLVIRQGPIVKATLFQQFGTHLILDEIVARLGKEHREQKEQIRRETSRLDLEQRSMVEALGALERLEQLRQKLSDLEGYLATVRANARARAAEAERSRELAATLRADLARARMMGAIGRFFSGLNPARLEREAEVTERAAQTAQDAAHALDGGVTRKEANVASVRAEVERLSATTRSYPPASDLRLKLNALHSRLAHLNRDIAVIDGKLVALQQEVLTHCRILATTVYRTYLGAPSLRRFDVVVIDEASMLMAPLVYYAAGLAIHSATVAGDFRQLAPIVKSNGGLANQWLKRDVFEKAGFPVRLQQHERPSELVALRTQYRMHETICEMVSQLFYSDLALRSDPSVACRDHRFPLGSSPLIYANTAAFHPWAARPRGKYGRYNLFHALLIRNILSRLAEAEYLSPLEAPNEAMGVVSPYAPQAELIHKLIEERLGAARAAGIAATVHRFQGNEKDAIVIDLADSFGEPLGRFFRAVQLEDDGARLLNVAASRARHHVVLLGNFDYIRAHAPPHAIVRRLIAHFEQRGEPLELDRLLPLKDRDWVDGLQHGLAPNLAHFHDGEFGWFDQDTFYPAFGTDLAHAQNSIVIFSPFATQPGTGRWVEPLHSARQRGVQVRIFMKRLDNQDDGAAHALREEIVSTLNECGIAVEQRNKEHRKIAVIDGRVLWHGSLNIFSHRNTIESMFRIEKPDGAAMN